MASKSISVFIHYSLQVYNNNRKQGKLKWEILGTCFVRIRLLWACTEGQGSTLQPYTTINGTFYSSTPRIHHWQALNLACLSEFDFLGFTVDLIQKGIQKYLKFFHTKKKDVKKYRTKNTNHWYKIKCCIICVKVTKENNFEDYKSKSIPGSK